MKLLPLVVVVVVVAAGCNARVTNGDDYSSGPNISGNGRYVAFTSRATNLVAGDDNGEADIFLWHRDDREIVRLTDGNDTSFGGLPSDDGDIVAFSSYASNLVPDDDNGMLDTFVWEAATGAITRIAGGNGASYVGGITPDGRFVTFMSEATDLIPGEIDPNYAADAFVWDRVTDTTVRVTAGNEYTFWPDISADGRYVVFHSIADDLVPGDTNGTWDVFRWDRTTGTTERVSHGNDESRYAAISGDGRFVAYSSRASDLVPGDTNGSRDVFVWDGLTGVTTLIPGGEDWTAPSITHDGSEVAFTSGQKVHLVDWQAGTSQEIPGGDRYGFSPSISADGRSVAYVSPVNGVNDIFLWFR